MTAPSRVLRLRAVSRGSLHRVAPALHARGVGAVVSFLALRVLVRPAARRAAQTADGRAHRRAPARAAPGGGADRRTRRGAADRADYRADRRAFAGLGRGIEAGLLLRPRLTLAAVARLLLRALALGRVHHDRGLRRRRAAGEHERDHKSRPRSLLHAPSSRIVPSPPGCGQAFGSHSRNGRTRHPALSSPSRTARTIFDAPGLSPWQQMVCTEISISTPSSVLTLPSIAILTACAAARSGSVIREPASLRETSEPSTLYARSAKPSEATRTPRLRQAASYLPDASVIKISSGPDSSTASPAATASASSFSIML